jgi:hypothetical protein
MKHEVLLRARARCFRGSNGGSGILGTYRFTVDPSGTVRVYDDVAGHYTTLHGMTKKEESRVRNLAVRQE